MFSESRWIHRHFFDAKKLSSIFQKWSEKKAGLWSPQKAGRECKYLLHTSLRLTYWATRIAENPLKTNMTIENQPWMKMYLLSKLVTFSLPWWCFPGGSKKNIDTLTGSSSLGWVSSTHKAFHCAKFSAICVDTSAEKNLGTSESIAYLVGGWINPFEKYERQNGYLPQGSGWKLEKWNHHLVMYIRTWNLRKKILVWKGETSTTNHQFLGSMFFSVSGCKCSKMSGFKYLHISRYFSSEVLKDHQEQKKVLCASCHVSWVKYQEIMCLDCTAVSASWLNHMKLVHSVHMSLISDSYTLNVFKKPVGYQKNGCPFASFFRPILKKKGRPLECRHRPSWIHSTYTSNQNIAL